MRFSYETAQPGVNRLSRAFLNPTREQAESDELKSLANAGYLRARMGKEQAESGILKQRSDYLSDPTEFVSQQSGVPLPQARQYTDYSKTGNWGVKPPATPNDDDGNALPAVTMDEIPEAIKPLMDKLRQATQAYGALKGADKANPEQIADSLGKYKGQDATAEVQDLVRGGRIDDASALNQGSKLGERIKMFDNIGNTGAVYSPGSGEVVAGKNALLDAFKNNASGKGQAYTYSLDENGNRVATFVPGGPADPARKNEKITDSERTTVGYAKRMEAAEKLMESVPAGQTPGLAESAASGVPLAGKMLSNLARNDERQQYRQAQEDWVRSKLRKESGAVIADEEMDREIRVYFPQIGDSAAVIQQKKESREVAMEAMRQASGPAYNSPDVKPKAGVNVIRYDAQGNRIK